jgi:hypothetical protein
LQCDRPSLLGRRLRGFCGDARPLQVLNLSALPLDLAAHVLDFVSDSV